MAGEGSTLGGNGEVDLVLERIRTIENAKEEIMNEEVSCIGLRKNNQVMNDITAALLHSILRKNVRLAIPDRILITYLISIESLYGHSHSDRRTYTITLLFTI